MTDNTCSGRLESLTFRSEVQRANHYTTVPPPGPKKGGGGGGLITEGSFFKNREGAYLK